MRKRRASTKNIQPFKKKFIHKNEGFLCKKCRAEVTPIASGCRNHCTECLYSLHVDKDSPGDRESSCHGLMKPLRLHYSGKKGYTITHLCLKCGKTIPNKTAPDDNLEAIISLMKEQNQQHE